METATTKTKKRAKRKTTTQKINTAKRSVKAVKTTLAKASNKTADKGEKKALTVLKNRLSKALRMLNGKGLNGFEFAPSGKLLVVNSNFTVNDHLLKELGTEFLSSQFISIQKNVLLHLPSKLVLIILSETDYNEALKNKSLELDLNYYKQAFKLSKIETLLPEKIGSLAGAKSGPKKAKSKVKKSVKKMLFGTKSKAKAKSKPTKQARKKKTVKSIHKPIV